MGKSKKYILLVMSFVFMGIVYSQERIITVEGDTIYAKIIEVNDHAVSYKRYNYQGGATFVLAINKINSIRWENGVIDVYDPTTNTLVSNNPDPQADYIITSVLPAIVDRRRSDFIFDNGTKMDESEFELFMMANNVERYWKKYNSGKRLYRTGTIMMISGGGAVVLGSALVGFYFLFVPTGSLFGDPTNVNAIWNGLFQPYRDIGRIVVGLGSVAFTTALFLTIAGTVKRNTFVDTYNERCAGKHPSEVSENVLSWKLQPMANGLSFTLNF
jgi:hypothetical protein